LRSNCKIKSDKR